MSFAAHADDAPTVTKYRPSVSAPAQLSAPGWLEVEMGLQRSRAADPQRRDTLPDALKRRFAVDDASAFGLEAGIKFATARTGLGSGHTDAGLTGIYSSAVAPAAHRRRWSPPAIRSRRA